MAGREIVDHGDGVAVLVQGIDEVGADEPGAAGDEDARHEVFSVCRTR